MLALSALTIGAMIFLLGPSTTGSAFAIVLNAAASTPLKVEGLAAPNVHNELRFYSVLWIA